MVIASPSLMSRDVLNLLKEGTRAKLILKLHSYYDNDVLKKEEVVDASGGNMTITLYDKDGNILKP